MTTYTWHQQRDRATKAFNGETPVTAQLEQTIIEAFEQDPVLVVHAIDRIAAAFTAGKITSGWAVLKVEIERATENKPARDATATDNKHRAKAIARARTWITTTGIHLDRPDEIDDELFGDRGQLHPWHQDENLRQQMLNHWHDTRHAGTRLEREAYVRAEHWKRTRARIQGQRQPATIPDDLPSVPLDVRLDTEPDPEDT